MKNHLPMHKYVDVKYIRKTTAVNLNFDIEVIRSNYSSMTQRNINKAEKNCVSCIEVEKIESNINIFIDLYTETMDRNNASNFYYFDLELISAMLKESRFVSSHLLFAHFEGRVVSAVILYLCGEMAHYHLGASKNEFLYLKPNNKLFDYMIHYSKENGAKILHLGGGYDENDGLFAFKSSFTNNNHFEYFLGKKVFNYGKYNELINYYSKKNILSNSYFPIYRGIVKTKEV